MALALAGASSEALGVAFFASPNLQGNGSGSGQVGATFLSYSGTTSGNFTASEGGGGTSGGLGEGANRIATTFASCNAAITTSVLPSSLVETEIRFSLSSISQSLGVADSSGTISSGAQLSIFIDVPGVGLLPYSVERSGSISFAEFVPHSNGASFSGGFLTPGRYQATVSVSSGVTFSSGQFRSSGNGGIYAIKIIPAPATVGAFACLVPLVTRRRRAQ